MNVVITNPYLDHSVADLITRAKGFDAIYDKVVETETTPAEVWSYITRTLTDFPTVNFTSLAVFAEYVRTGLVTVEGYTDTIESLLENLTYGLSALHTDISAIPTTPELEADALSRYTTITGYVDEIESLLKNVTYGLSALHTDISAIPITPELETDALSRYTTLVGYVDEIEGLLKNVTYGLSALRTLIVAIPLTPELEADALSRYNALVSYVDEVESLLKNATYGLSALQVLVSAIPTTPELEANALTRYNTLAGYVDEVESLLKNVTYGLSALDTQIDTIDANVDIIVADTPYLADAALPVTPTAGSIGRLVKDYLDVAISSRLASASYMTERGTDNALLAANYVTERGTDNAALASVCTEARLAELGATNMPADIDTLLTRLSSLRAGYLDYLASGTYGLAALNTDLDAIIGYTDEVESLLKNGTYGLVALNTDLDSIITKMS